MDIKLSFLGAAQNVTGSRHLLQANSASVLVDCGLYQERHFINRNWDTPKYLSTLSKTPKKLSPSSRPSNTNRKSILPTVSKPPSTTPVTYSAHR